MTPEEYKQLLAKNKPKKKRILLEDDIIQNQLLPFLRLMKNSNRLPPDIWWSKITNETIGGSAGLRIKQWRMDKIPGVGDYLLAWGINHGWIEVKQPGGIQSAAQTAFQACCSRRKVPYAVVHNIEELEAALKEWGILK